MKCVYKLKCRDTNITEFYIGSSVNFNQRKIKHKTSCNNLNSREYCSPLYMFINVNGGFDNWEFEVIKEFKFITEEELHINEQYYKEKLKPHLNSINAVGYDDERKITTKKKNDKIQKRKKGICPHCNKEMLNQSIRRHIKNKHTII